MGLIDRINSDLKQALISGDKLKSETLKSIKNTLQYVQTSADRQNGDSEKEIQSVLKKESKKRQEAAEAYQKAGDSERGDEEKQEKAIIDSYLPEQMDLEQLDKLIESVMSESNIERTPKNMGAIIKLTRDKAGASADGAQIAMLVKEKVLS